jgi:hypothetical protein
VLEVVVQAQVVELVVVGYQCYPFPYDIVRQTRLPERDYHQQREPQQETGEGWP